MTIRITVHHDGARPDHVVAVRLMADASTPRSTPYVLEPGTEMTFWLTQSQFLIAAEVPKPRPSKPAPSSAPVAPMPGDLQPV